MPASTSVLTTSGFDEVALFVDVAETGSVTAAARRLGLPKSTVSRALSRLEQKLGVALVRRSNRGHVLTEQGVELAATVSAHVVGIRDATLSLGRAQSEPYGTVRVTAPIDLGEQVVGPLLPGFMARYPRLRVEVEISQRFVDVISEGVDLALRVSGKPLTSSSLRGRKLATLDLGLYAAPSYLAQQAPVKRPDDLTRCEHVLFRGVRGTSQLVVHGSTGSTEIRVSGRVNANDFHLVRAAVVAGGGIGTLPWFMAHADVAAGRLVRLLPKLGLRGATVYLLHAPARPIPRKTEALRDYLLAHAPALLTAS